jgi:hypothetical protein
LSCVAGGACGSYCVWCEPTQIWALVACKVGSRNGAFSVVVVSGQILGFSLQVSSLAVGVVAGSHFGCGAVSDAFGLETELLLLSSASCFLKASCLCPSTVSSTT